MNVLNAELNLNDFWSTVRQARARVLFLDYDGTLAPFKTDRRKAIPYPGIRTLLNNIQRQAHTRLVMVSGRWAEEVSPLLGLDRPPEIWGCHGWERLWPDGLGEMGPMSSQALRGLEMAAAQLREINFSPEQADLYWEKKPASVAVHFRAMPPETIQQMEDQVRPHWETLCEKHSLAVKSFDGGMELVVPTINKSRAVATVLKEMREGAERLNIFPFQIAAAYLGDDLTDEDGFLELNRDKAAAAQQDVTRNAGISTLSVLVGEKARESSADVHIRPPREVLEFLESWLKHTQ
ncbi:MAG: trehalose-phosphatase [Deltaproteobacteria bacterium]|nr:trehalose-phosphatase [Deltaproteobacteria bacterium]